MPTDLTQIDEPSNVIKSEDGQSTSLYRVDLCYNGESYFGFQSQPHGNCIQDFLERALATFCGHSLRVTAASRTDTGVHAEHQVVTFRSTSNLNCFKAVKALNSLLPKDIRVRSFEAVFDSFHPQKSSTGKSYRYRIWRSAGESPFISPFVWSITCPIDLGAMLKAAEHFIGTHDFSSFCASDSSAKSKIRRVIDISIIEHGPLIDIWVLGDGFLKQMVRNIVGALVAVGRGKLLHSEIPGLITARNRKLAPATAPAKGLCLVKIFYGDNVDTATLIDESKNGYNLSMAGKWH